MILGREQELTQSCDVITILGDLIVVDTKGGLTISFNWGIMSVAKFNKVFSTVLGKDTVKRVKVIFK